MRAHTNDLVLNFIPFCGVEQIERTFYTEWWFNCEAVKESNFVLCCMRISPQTIWVRETMEIPRFSHCVNPLNINNEINADGYCEYIFKRQRANLTFVLAWHEIYTQSWRFYVHKGNLPCVVGNWAYFCMKLPNVKREKRLLGGIIPVKSEKKESMFDEYTCETHISTHLKVMLLEYEWFKIFF